MSTNTTHKRTRSSHECSIQSRTDGTGERQKISPAPKALQPLDLAKEHAVHLVYALKESFKLDPTRVESVDEIANHWIALSDKVPLEKLLKKAYPALFSRCMDQEEPQLPVCLSAVFPSKLWRFLRSLMARINRDLYRSDKRATRAIYDAGIFGLMKKGAPMVSSKLLEASIEAHKTALCESQTGVHHPDIHPIDDAMLENSIERAVDILFPPTRKPSRVSGKIPSFNGTFESGRRNFGMLGELIPSNDGRTGRSQASKEQHQLRKEIRDLAGTPRLPYLPREFHYERRNNAELWSMGYAPKCGVVHIYRVVAAAALSKMNLFSTLSDVVTGRENFSARAAFIKEPLKVRPILAGPTAPYYLLFQLQSDLWKCLGDCPATYLTCNPISEGFLSDFFGTRERSPGSRHLDPTGNPDNLDAWLSGDYESATDNFRKRFTEVAWNRIARNRQYGRMLTELGVSSLTRHNISYEPMQECDRYENRVRVGTEELGAEAGWAKGELEQTNGQSMGSPISFPVLCAINYGICLLAFEESMSHENWQEVLKDPTQLPLLINGDDNLLNINRHGKERWEYWANVSGSKSSVGKTYYSHYFFQINSQLFTDINSDYAFPVAGRILAPIKAVKSLCFGLLGPVGARGADIRHWTDLEALWGWLKTYYPVGGDPEKWQPRLAAMFTRGHLRDVHVLADFPDYDLHSKKAPLCHGKPCKPIFAQKAVPKFDDDGKPLLYPSGLAVTEKVPKNFVNDYGVFPPAPGWRCREHKDTSPSCDFPMVECLIKVQGLMKDIPVGVPYSAPTWLGGAGLPTDGEISHPQKVFMNYCLKQNRAGRNVDLVLRESLANEAVTAVTSDLHKFRSLVPLDDEESVMLERYESRKLLGRVPMVGFDARIDWLVSDAVKLRPGVLADATPRFRRLEKERNRFFGHWRKAQRSYFGSGLIPPEKLRGMKPFVFKLPESVAMAHRHANIFRRDLMAMLPDLEAISPFRNEAGATELARMQYEKYAFDEFGHQVRVQIDSSEED